MSNRSKAAGAGAPGRRRLESSVATVLAAFLLTSTVVVVSGDARAEDIVLKSGEVVEGSIIEATRNTVIVQRSIGGMRQMPIQDIAEVRFDLAQGLRFAGELLGWADGVYEVRSGDQIIRVSESGILSREPSQQAARLPPTRARGQQQSTAATAPSTTPIRPAAEPTAASASERQNRSRAAASGETDAAAADAQRAAADNAERQRRDAQARAAAVPERQASDTEPRAAAVPQRQVSNTAAQAVPDSGEQAVAKAKNQAAAEGQRPAAADVQAQAAVERQSQAAAGAETRAAADTQKPAAAGKQVAAVDEQEILAVKASVDPPEPGARSMVFNIELSRPAEQTVVLIYGTVDGTAKAGEDYEAQQGMVTVAPGARSAEVRVPLIEGAPEDGEKRFELVLMADPKVAQVVDRRVIATIEGGD
jgi:Calx-beta domain